MATIARLLLFYVLFQTPVFADEEIHLQLDSLQTEYISTGAIELSYGPQQSTNPGVFLRAQNIRSPYFENQFSASLRCADASYSLSSINCAVGVIEIESPDLETIIAHFNFEINILDKSGELALQTVTKRGKLDALYHAGKDGNWRAEINSEGLALSFLSPLITSLAEVFKEHVIVAGKANLQLRLRGHEKDIDAISLNAEVTELSIEGESILEKVALDLQTDIKRTQANWTFISMLSFLDGEMYIQPGLDLLGEQPGFYIESTPEPLKFRLAGNWFAEDRQLELQDLYYLHPDILQLQGSVRLSLAEQISYSDLALRVSVPDLSTSYPVYIQPILLQTNFSDLELSGAIDLSLDYWDSELNKMELLIDDVYLDDVESRFSISALNSRLALDSNQQAVQSNLAWSGMSFYRLDFGPGDIVFESMGKDVSVLEWQDVSILDGGLKIEEFSIRNLASSDFEIKIGGELTPISMQTLTHALGWTIFPGKLSGRISGLKYAHNNLQLESDITINLFGGQMNIQELQVADLFSSYSVLTTDIKIDKLDLEQLTDVFTFGKIEGSLSGRMGKLRLEDWQPSYFEAEFATPEDDDKPHRISQKALENLNELGGGLSGTLSKGFLRFLPAYSYGRLGLTCRLNKGICELGGVEDSGDSFSILTKGGLLPPWVEVKGAGRSIKWDDLIGGLKQIAAGEVAIE
jgi:hypothetical protein